MGTMLQVYRAMLQGSTPVAVKFVSGHSPKEQSRFKNEVEILKGLRHTNIVQFLGASFAGGQIMLVTEFLPRGDLWRALSNDNKHIFSWYNRCVAHFISRKEQQMLTF
jgi:serine/threonine protein kinase